MLRKDSKITQAPWSLPLCGQGCLPAISKVLFLVEGFLFQSSFAVWTKVESLTVWSWGICQMGQDQGRETSEVTVVFVW